MSLHSDSDAKTSGTVFSFFSFGLMNGAKKGHSLLRRFEALPAGQVAPGVNMLIALTDTLARAANTIASGHGPLRPMKAYIPGYILMTGLLSQC